MNEIDATRGPRTADWGRDARGFEVSLGGILRGGASFHSLSQLFRFAFISLSIGFLLTFFPGVLRGGAAGFGSWTVCTIRGMAAQLGRGRGADSRAGMPVRPAVRRARPWGGFRGCAWADSAAALPEAAQAAEGHLTYRDTFREGSMRRHRDYLVSALVFSVSLMSK